MHQAHKAVVALAIEGREDEDEDTERDTRIEPLAPLLSDAVVEATHLRVYRGEVVGHNTAEAAE